MPSFLRAYCIQGIFQLICSDKIKQRGKSKKKGQNNLTRCFDFFKLFFLDNSEIPDEV